MSASSQGAGLSGRLPLIGLYPAAYRASHGEEIAAVFAESVEGTDRTTVMREWAALAAHAVRLRTRLSSRDPAGRILAGAAPFLLAGGAGLAAVQLLMGFFVTAARFDPGGSNPTAVTAVGAVQTVPWILALLCAALGRWGLARLLVLAGTLARIGAVVGFLVHPAAAFAQYFFLFPFWLLLAVPMLIAPPDGVDRSARSRAETAIAAIAIALPMSALVLLWPWPGADDYSEPVFPADVQRLLDISSAWPALVMATAFLVHLAARHPDRLRSAGVALAVIPWTVMLAPPYYWRPPRDLAELGRNAAAVAGLLVIAAGLAALRRALASSAEPAEPVERY
ncbi:hypothetical protein ACIGZJ_19970 [Kitasatospora sp. NPDC052868]|uniref:hypothetical protein n=1 Tax=Kitasatospora sp. NPDC052868 TaxID=3364060 RepID=UPI0037CA979E